VVLGELINGSLSSSSFHARNLKQLEETGDGPYITDRNCDFVIGDTELGLSQNKIWHRVPRWVSPCYGIGLVTNGNEFVE
jgi:hypothetical protein